VIQPVKLTGKGSQALDENFFETLRIIRLIKVIYITESECL